MGLLGTHLSATVATGIRHMIRTIEVGSTVVEAVYSGRAMGGFRLVKGIPLSSWDVQV
jgi:hypothetical protein